MCQWPSPWCSQALTGHRALRRRAAAATSVAREAERGPERVLAEAVRLVLGGAIRHS